MGISDEVKEWWMNALLGGSMSAHPVFGHDIEVQVDGEVVTLQGTVDSADQIQEIEREARSIAKQRPIVNHLAIAEPPQTQHMQTIIAVFPNQETARLASQTVVSSKLNEDGEPEVVELRTEARNQLRSRMRAARVPKDRIRRYLDMVDKGKVLLIDRVPEDNAFRAISALEGTSAESVQTLPPEPHSFETG